MTSSPVEDFDEEIVLPELNMDGPSTSQNALIARMRIVSRPTTCLVCGTGANGYHYDVPSCNGCKNFFRRTLISGKYFECKGKEENCFDLNVRAKPQKCRGCRFKKCLAVGMNANAVRLTEEDEAQMRTSKRRRDDESPQSSPGEKCVDQKPDLIRFQQLMARGNRNERLIDGLLYLEIKVEQFRKCSYNPEWRLLPSLEEALLEHNRLSLADRAGPMPGWPFVTEATTSKGPPSPSEKPEKPMTNHPVYEPHKKSWLVHNLLTTVEYAKTFNFLHKLNRQDQLILLRYGALACMNLHTSFFSVAQKYDYIIHPDGTTPPNMSMMVWSKSNMSIAPLIRNNVQKTEYVLLKAICLSNPAVPDLSEAAQKILSEERELYTDALLAYCMSNPKLGPAHFAHLLGIIDTLEHQQRMQKDTHLLFMLPKMRGPNIRQMKLVDDIMLN